mmetsp:Transcript_53443/g.130097  ORF Transcript_53443/g.130097 Transcript_53443/m.130097 type:complete len:223 (+) Transcript_53443:1299-1967(+)
MEIASPLSLHSSSTTGTKRQFSTSSPMREENYDVASTSNNITEESAKDDTPQTNPFKRRRCLQPSGGGATKEHSHKFSSTSSSVSLIDRGSFSSPNLNNFFNGNLHDVENAAAQSLIRSQAEEIKTLRAENDELQNKLQTTETEQMKTSEENRILKRGVAIQAERHNQVVSELVSTKQENAELKDRNGKLELQVQSLRYQLQAQMYNRPSNDFMGFRPPDVF